MPSMIRGPGQRERAAVHDEHPVLADRPHRGPAVRPRRRRPRRQAVRDRAAAGQQDEHLRVHLDDRGPAGRSRRLAGLAEHLPAAREPDLVGHPAAGRPGRVHLVEDDDPRRRKPVVLAPDDDLGQDLEPLAEVLDDREGLVLGLGHRPDRDDRVEHALHGAGREGQDRRGPVALEGALAGRARGACCPRRRRRARARGPRPRPRAGRDGRRGRGRAARHRDRARSRSPSPRAGARRCARDQSTDGSRRSRPARGSGGLEDLDQLAGRRRGP